MKLFRKIIIALLILSMTIGMCAFAQTDDASSGIDIQSYNENVDFITSLGIYSFSGEEAGATVSRAAFAKMVADLIGVSGDYSGGNYFEDVSLNGEYSDEIGAMAALEIMNGVGNGCFAPDTPITYTQAIKTVVSALGYKPAATVAGGYSDGYMRCAYNIGIVKNAPYDFDAPLTFDAAANLIRLAAEADVYEIVYLSGERIYYGSREDNTVLNVYHDIYTDEGIMTDNGVTALSSKTLLAENCCKIGNRVLVCTDNDKRDYLGYYVEYYYRDTDDALLYVREKTGRNETVTVAAEDIMGDDASFSKKCLVASVNGKKRTYKIDAYANLIYNGGLDETFTGETLKIKDGFIRLIDADLDGDYEVVIAEEYVDIVASLCNSENKKITAEYSTVDYAYIDYDGYISVVFQNADGQEINSADVKPGSVISVFRSKNKEKIRFVVSEATAEIVADSVETDSDGNITVMYNGTVYSMSSTYNALMKKDSAVYVTPAASTSYKLYLNYEGNVAMLLETQGRLQYAYMMAAAKSGTGMNSNKVSVKLHLESDDTAVVPVADKLTLDGVKNKSGSDILESSVLFSSGVFKPQLVMVRINANGELKELDLATNNTGSAFGFDLDNFSLDYASTSAMSPRQINSIRTQNGYQIIDSNTVVFSLNNNSKELEATEDDSVRALSWSDYKKRYGSSYIKMYDADESWSVGAIVICEPLDISGDRVFVVTEAYMQKDADGEYKQAINGWWTDDYRSFLEAEDGILSAAIKKRYPDSDGKIKAGDIFEVGFSIDEKINQAKMLYSPQRDTSPDYTYFDLNGVSGINDDDNFYILGYPCYVSADRISTYSGENKSYVSPTGSASTTKEAYTTTILPSTTSTAFMVYQFDCITKEVTVITRDEIPQGAQLTATGYGNFDTDTKVFMKRIDGSVKDIMVITNMGANYSR